MKFLPKSINWISPYECSPNSWRMVLVAVNKHSFRDWEILFGCINPVDDYSDYKIEVGNREIEKSEVIAVGLLQTYGNVG